jgi:hypothetical protein
VVAEILTAAARLFFSQLMVERLVQSWHHLTGVRQIHAMWIV